MSTVVITGGAGFIGSNLALQLEADGYDVIAVDNFQSGTRDNLKEFRGETRDWDVTRHFEIDRPVDFVFHHGDITDPRHPNDEEVFERNLAGFENVYGLARTHGARLVYASTAGLYGDGPIPMREDQPQRLQTAYGKSKSRMDELAQSRHEEISIVGLRYFNVFGPRETHKGRAASMVLHLSRQMLQGNRPRLFNYGEQKRDFVYVKDVVLANLCAMKAPSGIYNVGTGVDSTFNELVVCLNQALSLNLEPDYFAMPYDPGSYQAHTQAFTGKASELLKFTRQWPLQEAVVDYMKWLES